MQEASDFVLFLGRFHPLVVHLPIGILLFAFLLEITAHFKKNTAIAAAIPIALLSGAITALIACVLGYMLSLSGDYDENMLDNHFWFGVGTTIVTFLAWCIQTNILKIEALQKIKSKIATLTLIVLLVSITGHYGGNLTHGSDYLFKYAPSGKTKKKELPPIASIEEAGVYDYLVDPILQDKCASCHNSEKKKGGLSYENLEALMEGGEDGPALIAGNATESEMVKRFLLPTDHENFMPPDGKTPLTEEEKSLLIFWINDANADGSILLKDTKLNDTVRTIASNRLGFGDAASTTDLPTAPVIDIATYNELKELGFTVRELTFESNLLEVVLNTSNKKNAISIAQKLEKLQVIKENIVWLTLSNTNLKDDDVKLLENFNNLTILKIDNNPISDIGIHNLPKMPKLESLNIYGTQVTKKCLDTFSNFPTLKKVYVWKTNIKKQDLESYLNREDYPQFIYGE